MGVTVRRAGESDREALVRLLEETFHDDPVSSWVFPDEARRAETHGRFMGCFLDAALGEGWVDMTEDGTAVALWLQVPAGEPEGEDDTPALMREASDPDNERAELVGRLTGAIHPYHREHAYLLLVAVADGEQGRGLGSALLGEVLDRCDREGLAAYLEASNVRSRELYERLGFRLRDRPLQLPDGPPMFPMWREPQGV
ncbi:GNAT family N-acetyltransferase [Streptomyces triticagri]|uniref:GNAT family N-acetyltransferase n=1 Tax=Streptomyces triticagri TaxID=2293568 RepID=A0A372M1K5_9ACTN|nr:GNAT family N-acetyltransferase [Streptomyces triticagri]RFU84802.1 GNAT family N-acetyltransferase [Streptomyces triticagri]